MKRIPLSASRRCANRSRFESIVDDDAFDRISKHNWTACVCRKSEPMYVFAARKERDTATGKLITVLLHRDVWEFHNGPIPNGVTIDHIEQGEYGGLDNRVANLRLASRQQQQGNRRKTASRSGFKGVYLHKRANKWAAQIHVNDYPSYLGLFSSADDAARAYDQAALVHFGAYAKLNFPEKVPA